MEDVTVSCRQQFDSDELRTVLTALLIAVRLFPNDDKVRRLLRKTATALGIEYVEATVEDYERANQLPLPF